MTLKTRIHRLLLKLEIYAHEVDAYLSRAGGNYEFAADSILRKVRCQRQLDLLDLQ